MIDEVTDLIRRVDELGRPWPAPVAVGSSDAVLPANGALYARLTGARFTVVNDLGAEVTSIDMSFVAPPPVTRFGASFEQSEVVTDLDAPEDALLTEGGDVLLAEDGSFLVTED